MKAFAFQDDQLIRIITALCADELARKYGRYTETMTISSWNAETRLGRGGIDASVPQQEALAARVAQFFGYDAEVLPPKSGDAFGDWVERLQSELSQNLTYFRFHPATQSGDADTRHNAAETYQDAAAVASLMQGRRRAVSLVSPHSLMGLICSVLVPNLLNIEVVDARGIGPDTLGDQLRFGDIVIATPTLWRYLADTLPGMANNVMGLTFGERFTIELAGRLRQRGLGAMRELYGSTETGVVAWRDSPPDNFVLFDHWASDENAIIRNRPDGQQTRLMPMDDLEWKSGRSFSLGGRRDGAVQIGAVNVFPLSISGIIADHPAVESCTVRVSQRAGALDRLIADIMLKDGGRPDQAMAWAIDEWCRGQLTPPERPRIYNFFTAEEELEA